MELRYPSYYDVFSCIADRCPDSCCHEWEVQVDADSAARYRAMEGPLGDALREHLYDEDGETYLRNENGRCPMWRMDGLCRIQAERGHDALCTVCLQFPRLRHDYGVFLELGLELSCPEAARLILSDREDLFVTWDAPGGSEPDYERATMAVLLSTRSRALKILEGHDIPTALALLLVYSAHAQADVDAGEVTDFDETAAMTMLASLSLPDPRPLTDFYAGLELLTDRWAALLRDPHRLPHWPEEIRAMARCQIHRYWLQAVSDWELAARVKMIVASCILVRQLGADVISTAQLYSKEIDNDADNIDAILDAAYTSAAFTDLNLLALLTQ